MKGTAESIISYLKLLPKWQKNCVLFVILFIGISFGIYLMTGKKGIKSKLLNEKLNNIKSDTNLIVNRTISKLLRNDTGFILEQRSYGGNSSKTIKFDNTGKEESIKGN